MRILCTAKDSHIFSTKNNSVFVTLADICLTNLCLNDIVNAALTYTEYPLRILKFEIRAEITKYDANGQGGDCRKRCFCEFVMNACESLQMS